MCYKIIMNNDEIINFYKKKIEPYVAIFILAFLITGLFLLYQDNQLKKEISKNCGYETKHYQCYCEKKMIDEFKIKLGYYKENPNISNVTLDK